MVPTYFRRELRDRALQRRLRLRTLFCILNVRVRPRQSPQDCIARVCFGRRRKRRMPATRSKAELRARALAAREAISETKRNKAAQTLAKRGLPFPIAPGTVVSGY